RLVLMKEEDERERVAVELAIQGLDNPVERKRSVTVAVLLSALCAGAGQIFNRQYLKGGVLMAAWLLSMFGWADLFKFVLTLGGAKNVAFTGTLVGLGLLGLLVYIFS